ncbi:DELTA-stichotoxin-Hcr4b-like [Symphorus nematophorus]
MEVVDGLDVARGVTGIGLSIGSTISKLIPTQRKCTVELANESSNYTLRNPRVYVASGRCTSPLPTSIPPSSTGEASFVKPHIIPRGCSGIFTYDLLNNLTKSSSYKIAVLFSVPFDCNLKSNVYAVGVYEIRKECNQALFQEMSKSENAEEFVSGKAKGPSLTHQSQDVTIMATMSDCYEPIMKVQVCDD